MEERWMGTGETSEILHLSQATVTRWCREGRFSKVKKEPDEYGEPEWRVEYYALIENPDHLIQRRLNPAEVQQAKTNQERISELEEETLRLASEVEEGQKKMEEELARRESEYSSEIKSLKSKLYDAKDWGKAALEVLDAALWKLKRKEDVEALLEATGAKVTGKLLDEGATRTWEIIYSLPGKKATWKEEKTTYRATVDDDLVRKYCAAHESEGCKTKVEILDDGSKEITVLVPDTVTWTMPKRKHDVGGCGMDKYLRSL